MIIFILVFTIGFNLAEADPCENYSQLPFADLRFVNNVYNSNDDAINDRYLTAGWYRAGDQDMPVTMPNFLSCGTKSPIWLNGTIPPISSTEFSRKACVVVGGIGCMKEYSIKVKNCTTYRVYYLVPTSASHEGYCFGKGKPGQKPTYTPPKAEVEVTTTYLEGLKGFSAECKFEESTEPLFYQVTWYIDGIYLTSMTPELFRNISMSNIVLDETNLRTLGRYVACSVRAKLVSEGPPGLFVKSADKYFGVEVVSTHVYIERGKSASIRLRPTVPIGCLPDGSECDLGITLFTPQTDDDCHGLTTPKPSGCGTTIKTANWSNEIEVSVTVDEEDGHDTFDAVFDVVLRTDNYQWHPIWSGYTLPLIKVIVGDKTGLDKGACQANNDPHMLTFDQRPYDIQYPGDFIMYRHTQYPIQV